MKRNPHTRTVLAAGAALLWLAIGAAFAGSEPAADLPPPGNQALWTPEQ